MGLQKRGVPNINAPYPITLSSLCYLLGYITDLDILPNHDCYIPISVNVPKDIILNPTKNVAISTGNVEMAQKIVGVLLLAFSKAIPKILRTIMWIYE